MHWVKLGLFSSSTGTGKLTSLPYVGTWDLKYAPDGNTESAARPYCRISRRRSPRRCAVSHSQSARSRNSKPTAPPAAVAESVVSAPSVDVGVKYDGGVDRNAFSVVYKAAPLVVVSPFCSCASASIKRASAPVASVIDVLRLA